MAPLVKNLIFRGLEPVSSRDRENPSSVSWLVDIDVSIGRNFRRIRSVLRLQRFSFSVWAQVAPTIEGGAGGVAGGRERKNTSSKIQLHN